GGGGGETAQAQTGGTSARGGGGWGAGRAGGGGGWGAGMVVATTAVMLAVSQGPGLAMLRREEGGLPGGVREAEVEAEVLTPMELDERPEARLGEGEGEGGVRDV
ncbi:MAG: hypothetical protein AAF328_07045, partial [Planctomycetota bacterium]